MVVRLFSGRYEFIYIYYVFLVCSYLRPDNACSAHHLPRALCSLNHTARDAAAAAKRLCYMHLKWKARRRLVLRASEQYNNSAWICPSLLFVYYGTEHSVAKWYSPSCESALLFSLQLQELLNVSSSAHEWLLHFIRALLSIQHQGWKNINLRCSDEAIRSALL